MTVKLQLGLTFIRNLRLYKKELVEMHYFSAFPVKRRSFLIKFSEDVYSSDTTTEDGRQYDIAVKRL